VRRWWLWMLWRWRPPRLRGSGAKGRDPGLVCYRHLLPPGNKIRVVALLSFHHHFISPTSRGLSAHARLRAKRGAWPFQFAPRMFAHLRVAEGEAAVMAASSRLAANVSPLVVAARILHLAHLTARCAYRWECRRREGRQRGRSDPAQRRRAQRRQVDRAGTDRLHLPINTPAGA
jgi:hypothetical protein